MDIPALLAAAGGLKTAGEIVAGMISAKNQTDVTSKAIELQSVIISLQSSIFEARDALATLQEENRQLKDSVVSAENLRRDMERYHLTTIRSGSVAYALKEAMSNGEPPHYVCANCSQDGKKSILHCGEHAAGWFSFRCPSCKTGIPTGLRGVSKAKYAEQLQE